MSHPPQDHQTALAEIRESLKKWEREFAARNRGQKPSQTDVKNDPDISSKYRQYNKLKRLSQSYTPRKTENADFAKQHGLREGDINRATTPRKALKSIKEVDGCIQQPEVIGTPAFIRCALGPTPQRDGQILGIFDALPSVSPSKDRQISTLRATPVKAAKLLPMREALATPRSRCEEERHETPLKRKRDGLHDTPSASQKPFTTPSFLTRRFVSPSIAEDCSEIRSLRFKKRPLVRSLSSMIQGLRDQEEQRMDDELDILNELEADEWEQPFAKKAKTLEPSPVVVQDSQAIQMPLGPDEIQRNSDDETEVDLRDANGQPRKPWKKKGLKRQTKRVIMRPVIHKPRKVDSESERVLETQLQATAGSEALPDDNEDEAEFHDDNHAPASPAKAERANRTKAKDTTEKGNGIVKKAAKKISASAHANFRKLKIKNKNSKASGRGRFGRK